MIFRQSVLGIGTSRLQHLVKSAHAIPDLEVGDIFADFVDRAGDVITLVDLAVLWLPVGVFPVLLRG